MEREDPGEKNRQEDPLWARQGGKSREEQKTWKRQERAKRPGSAGMGVLSDAGREGPCHSWRRGWGGKQVGLSKGGTFQHN